MNSKQLKKFKKQLQEKKKRKENLQRFYEQLPEEVIFTGTLSKLEEFGGASFDGNRCIYGYYETLAIPGSEHIVVKYEGQDDLPYDIKNQKAYKFTDVDGQVLYRIKTLNQASD